MLLVAALGFGFSSTPELRAQSVALTSTPAAVDLRNVFSQFGLPIKPQGRRDTCAVFTFTGALEFAFAKGIGQSGVRLSEEYSNWAANAVSRKNADGASYEDLIAGFDKWGIASEKYWRYASRYNPRGVPSKQAVESAREFWGLGFKRHWIAQRTENGLTDAQIVQMKKVLASGWPLCAYGRDHSILLVGYTDNPKYFGGGQFITRNSATQRYETIFYGAAKEEFGSVLWIELPSVTASTTR